MRKLYYLNKASMLVSIFILVIFLSSPLYCRDWEFSIADTVDYYVSDLKMRMGADGNIHLLYFNYDDELINHAALINSTWQLNNINLGYDFDNFAVDSFGNLHIVATDNGISLEELIYIVVASGGIYIDTLFSIYGRVLNADIELDNDDYPHVSANFFNQTGTYLLYCYQDTYGWHQDTVTFIDSDMGTTDIELLSNGDIGITSANPDSPGFVTYGLKHDSNWSTEIIYYYTDNSYHPAACLEYDNDNNPHVAVHINRIRVRGTIDFIDKTDSGWQLSSSLDSVYDAQRCVPVSISSTDIMNIAFCSSDSLNQGCYLGHRSIDSSAWNYEIVELGVTKNLVDMVMDENDNIYLCYIIDNHLKYAYSENGNSIFDGQTHDSKPGSGCINIYPNPANAAINIYLDNISGSFPVEMYVYDILGKTVYHRDNLIGKGGANSLILNFNSQDIISGASGLYILRIIGRDLDAYSKFILLK